VTYWDPRDNKIKRLQEEVAHLQASLDSYQRALASEMKRVVELEDELESKEPQDPFSDLRTRMTKLEERFEFVCRNNGLWDGT
jgi:chromosome segregation ATPase